MIHTHITAPKHQLSNDKVIHLLENSLLYERTMMLLNCLIDDCRNTRSIHGVQWEVRKEDTTRKCMLARRFGERRRKEYFNLFSQRRRKETIGPKKEEERFKGGAWAQGGRHMTQGGLWPCLGVEEGYWALLQLKI